MGVTKMRMFSVAVSSAQDRLWNMPHDYYIDFILHGSHASLYNGLCVFLQVTPGESQYSILRQCLRHPLEVLFNLYERMHPLEVLFDFYERMHPLQVLKTQRRPLKVLQEGRQTLQVLIHLQERMHLIQVQTEKVVRVLVANAGTGPETSESKEVHPLLITLHGVAVEQC